MLAVKTKLLEITQTVFRQFSIIDEVYTFCVATAENYRCISNLSALEYDYGNGHIIIIS